MSLELESKCSRYVLSRFRETREYIRRELDVLEALREGNPNKLIGQLPERVRTIVNNNSAMLRGECARHKPAYMTLVSDQLELLSIIYLWSEEGRFEDLVAKTLKNLSKEYSVDKAA